MTDARRGNKPDSINIPPNEYVKAFKWATVYDDSKAIKRLMDDFEKLIIKADDELKSQMAAYSDFKSALEVIERKETGTLMVKPLGGYVKKAHIVTSGHLTTLMVVIPKSRQQFFLDNYELLERQQKPVERKIDHTAERTQEKQREEKTDEEKGDRKIEETPDEKADRLEQEAEEEKKKLEQEIERKKEEKRKKLESMCENVIPGSAQLLHDEIDFCLYRVVVFRKGEATIKRLFRQERFTVRQFKYDPDDVSARREQKQRLREKRRTAWNTAVRWCKVFFERTFKIWIHVKVLRIFVESILRYGLPPDFRAYLIEKKPKSKDKLRSILKNLYASLGNASMMNEDTSSDTIVTTGLVGLSGDFHPYVSIDLNVDQDLS